MSDKAKKNLEALRTVSKAFETGDTSVIDAVVAEDFVDHTDRGDMGRDSLKAMIAMMSSKSDSTMKMEVIQEFANDDYAIGWHRYTGISDGSMGPKGPYNWVAMEVVKFNKDSKGIEHWSYMETREVIKMMGKDGTTPPATTDTTSHM